MAVWSFMTQDCLNMGFIGYSLEKNALYILQHDAEFKKKPSFSPFLNLDSITRTYFIVVYMQCFQYVFHSLISLQNVGYTRHVHGHQNNPMTPRIQPRSDRHSPTPVCNSWIRHCE